MNFLETSFQPNENQQQMLEHTKSAYFPWYFQENMLLDVNKENIFFYSHALRKRSGSGILPEEGEINSEITQGMEKLFLQIAKSSGVEVDVILRSAVNATHYATQLTSEIHVDHNFEHSNFLFYLNDVTGGETLVFDKDKSTILKTITPTKYKAVFFSGYPHAHKFCALGERRLVFVVTFIGKIPPKELMP